MQDNINFQFAVRVWDIPKKQKLFLSSQTKTSDFYGTFGKETDGMDNIRS